MTIDTPRPWLASYAEGVPHEIDEVTRSLAGLIRDSCADYRRRVALEFFGAETTYAELGEQIERAAEGLRRRGVRAGDRVALVLPNCPQHIVAFYAVLRLGAIVVEHNPLYTPRELRHQFEDHGARVAIAWDKTVATLHDFPADLRLDTIVSVDVTRAMPAGMRLALRLPVSRARSSRRELTAEATGGVRGTVRWEALLEAPRIRAGEPAPTPDDVAVIQYTSGTTGVPKGAMLSHRNLVANAEQARAWVPEIEPGSAVVYAILPMFHAYGLTLCLTFAMRMGARLVLFPKFDPELVLPVVKRHPPTFLPAVPPIYERLTRAAAEAGVSLRGIRIAISGAMALSQAVVAPWEEATGGMLVEGYGLSECSPVLIANPVSALRRVGTVGLPLPSTELRLLDPDDPRSDAAAGAPGEIAVRGPQVFAGYWRKPEASAEVFVDGWFRTGDIATIDDDGFVRIVDRAKELIITGGFNVSPTEVEDELRAYPGVADLAVVGLPNERNGEDVAAVVVVAPGHSVDPDSLRAWARERLAAYKVPRVVEFADELPRSMIGKVLRKQVRERLLER